MRLLFSGFVFMCFGLTMMAQIDFNIEEISYTGFEERGNDCWGYVDGNGLEYAIIGSRTATRIYSLEDPSNPIERAVISGSISTWRDIKSFGTFLYVTADSGVDGLLIIDMSDAPETITHDFWRPELTMAGVTDTLNACHNLYIDDQGTCYLAGCRIPERDRRGVILVDIMTDPWNPTVLGYETENYAHDVYVQGDRMFTSDIYLGEFSIYDVTDKSDPIYLGGAETSSSFTHNAWVSDDGNTVFTTDEVANAFVDAYDISDLADIKRLDIHKPPETVNKGVIPHNTHFLDNYLITSWYTDGIVITDVSRPDNMVKVGGFDTFEGPDGGFNGCWGVYPYLPSGLIIASSFRNAGDDPNGGFYILRPTYSRAALLQGIVSNSLDGTPVNQVKVDILNSESLQSITDPSGTYKTGVPEGGTYEVRFSHPEFYNQVVTIDLESENLNTFDISLDPKPIVTLDGTVISETDGLVVSDAFVSVSDGENNYIAKTDSIGEYSLEVFVGDYEIVIGKWAFLYAATNISINMNATYDFSLTKGYQDDFIFRSDWTETGDAVQGNWELVFPSGTFTFNNFAANPGTDFLFDYGDKALVTGNQGTEVDDDDVDSGTTSITSPNMDMSDIEDPHFHFAYWFFDQGSGTPDDSLEVMVTNGIDTATIFTTQHAGSEWNYIENIPLDGIIELTDSMRLVVRTADIDSTDHVVEAGFDAFLVTDGAVLNTAEDNATNFIAYPNPFNQSINIDWPGSKIEKAIMINQFGQTCYSFDVMPGNNTYDIGQSVIPGLYYLIVGSKHGQISYEKLVKL